MRRKRRRAAAYAAIGANTKVGKVLSDPANRTQAALVWRAIGAGAARFDEILAAIQPALRGKRAATVISNTRWYLHDLKRRKLVRYGKK